MNFCSTKKKDLGSAKSGAEHWIVQRFTAILLVLIIIFGACSLVEVVKNGTKFLDMLALPMSTLCGILFVFFACYHGDLGMQVIIEDYVHCHFIKTAMLIALKIVTITTIAAGSVALIFNHVMFFTK